MRGARVIGICGTEQKCNYLKDRLNFDETIDYKDTSEPLSAKLQRVCGDSGVDVYMDNVGGATSEAVLALMNESGRVPICGQISEYNNDVAYSTLLSADRLPTALKLTPDTLIQTLLLSRHNLRLAAQQLTHRPAKPPRH